MSDNNDKIIITYCIRFFSDWHCGSGFSGDEADAQTIKDHRGLPYVPGKTVKGLLREAADDLMSFSKNDERENWNGFIERCFGHKDKGEGCCGFSNAVLVDNISGKLIAAGLSGHLFRNVSSTAIGEGGTAVSKSLRNIEMTVPLTLEGRITDLNRNDKPYMDKCLKYTRRLGLSRTRGYGRCAFIFGGGQ